MAGERLKNSHYEVLHQHFIASLPSDIADAYSSVGPTDDSIDPVTSALEVSEALDHLRLSRNVCVVGADSSLRDDALAEVALQMLQLWRAKNTGPVPVPSTLRGWSESADIAEYIADQLSHVNGMPFFEPVSTSEMMKSGDLVLIFGGIDESNEAIELAIERLVSAGITFAFPSVEVPALESSQLKSIEKITIDDLEVPSASHGGSNFDSSTIVKDPEVRQWLSKIASFMGTSDPAFADGFFPANLVQPLSRSTTVGILTTVLVLLSLCSHWLFGSSVVAAIALLLTALVSLAMTLVLGLEGHTESKQWTGWTGEKIRTVALGTTGGLISGAALKLGSLRVKQVLSQDQLSTRVDLPVISRARLLSDGELFRAQLRWPNLGSYIDQLGWFVFTFGGVVGFVLALSRTLEYKPSSRWDVTYSRSAYMSLENWLVVAGTALLMVWAFPAAQLTIVFIYGADVKNLNHLIAFGYIAVVTFQLLSLEVNRYQFFLNTRRFRKEARSQNLIPEDWTKFVNELCASTTRSVFFANGALFFRHHSIRRGFADEAEGQGIVQASSPKRNRSRIVLALSAIAASSILVVPFSTNLRPGRPAADELPLANVEIEPIQPWNSRFVGAAWNRDGSELVVLDSSGSGDIVFTSKGIPPAVVFTGDGVDDQSVEFGADGSLVVSFTDEGLGDYSLRLSGRYSYDYEDLPIEGTGVALAISPDDSIVAAATTSTIYIYSLPDGELLEQLAAETFSGDLGFVSNDTLSVSSAGDARLWLWQAGDTNPQVSVEFESPIMKHCSHESGLVVTALHDGSVLVHDANDGDQIAKLPAYNKRVTALACDTLPDTMVIGFENGSVASWNLKADGLKLLHNQQSSISSLAVNAQDGRILSISDDSTANLITP